MASLIVADNKVFGFGNGTTTGMYLETGTTWIALKGIFAWVGSTIRKTLANYGTNQVLGWVQRDIADGLNGDIVLFDCDNLYSDYLTSYTLTFNPFRTFGTAIGFGSIATNGTQILLVNNHGTIATNF